MNWRWSVTGLPVAFGEEVETHGPDIYIMPIDDGVYAHEGGPAGVGRVEVGQVLAMGICTACTDEDGFDRGRVAQVFSKGEFHGFGIFEERERVRLHRGFDEVLDFLEGMRGLDVYALDGRVRGVGRGRGCARQALLMQRAEIEDEEDQTVLAAVVRERQLLEAVYGSLATTVGVYGGRWHVVGVNIPVLVQCLGNDA